ncbi:MAG: hypothetical protein M1827_007210 [Pycnora praestabilis]|nr:MAG: hypothetical protein M1827_007210 [Pycnora praestabilis]
MPPALDRLLARPSALDALRALLAGESALQGIGSSIVCQSCQKYRSQRSVRNLSAATASALTSDSLDYGDAKCLPAPSNTRPQYTANAEESLVRTYLPLLHCKVATPRSSDGAFTFEDLRYEADVKNTQDRGSRLVDHRNYKYDFGLWLELLTFRQRIDGSEGVKDIWMGLEDRGIDLLVNGEVADRLWQIFLSVAYKDQEFLRRIYLYSQRLFQSEGMRWPGLYEAILGHMLRMNPKAAFIWHKRLEKDHPPPYQSLRRLVPHALTNAQSLAAFRRIYIENGDHSVYNDVIPIICKRGEHGVAMKWHNLCLRFKDLPSSSAVVEPLREYLAIHGKPGHLQEFTKGLVDVGVTFASSTGLELRDNTKISREMMNNILGDTFGIAPKCLSDDFCARLFATQSFSISLILGGLRMLGMQTIGPVSLRALALRDKAPEAVLNSIAEVNRAGISIGSSVFSRAVRKFAKDRDIGLLDDLLSSDMHPDAFEDWKLQEILLSSYLHAQDWRQFNMTMAILMSFSSNTTSEGVWNLILRSHLTRGNLIAATQTIEEMRMRNLHLTPKSSLYLPREFLRHRRRGKRPVLLPVSKQPKDVSAVISLWMEVLRSGGEIPPSAWKEIFKRLGMEGQIDELKRLAGWLALWYSKTSLEKVGSRRVPHRQSTSDNPYRIASAHTRALPSSHPNHPLRVIFSTGLQRSIIEWGFKWSFANLHQSPVAKDYSEKREGFAQKPAEETWAQGLRILQEVSKHGVKIDNAMVQATCRMRLTILFGKGKSNDRANQLAAENNPLSLPEMRRDVERLSDPSLFNPRWSVLAPIDAVGQQDVLEESSEAQRWAPRSGCSIALPDRRLLSEM